MVRAVDSPEWKAVADHYETVKDVRLRDLFADDAGPR